MSGSNAETTSGGESRAMGGHTMVPVEDLAWRMGPKTPAAVCRMAREKGILVWFYLEKGVAILSTESFPAMGGTVPAGTDWEPKYTFTGWLAISDSQPDTINNGLVSPGNAETIAHRSTWFVHQFTTRIADNGDWPPGDCGVYDPRQSDGRAVACVRSSQLRVTREDAQQLLKAVGREPDSLDEPSEDVRLPAWASWESVAAALNPTHPEHAPRLAAAVQCWVKRHRDGQRDSLRSQTKNKAWLRAQRLATSDDERQAIAFVAHPKRLTDKRRRNPPSK